MVVRGGDVEAGRAICTAWKRTSSSRSVKQNRAADQLFGNWTDKKRHIAYKRYLYSSWQSLTGKISLKILAFAVLFLFFLHASFASFADLTISVVRSASRLFRPQCFLDGEEYVPESGDARNFGVAFYNTRKYLPYHDAAVENKAKYCKVHGYECYDGSDAAKEVIEEYLALGVNAFGGEKYTTHRYLRKSMWCCAHSACASGASGCSSQTLIFW